MKISQHPGHSVQLPVYEDPPIQNMPMAGQFTGNRTSRSPLQGAGQGEGLLFGTLDPGFSVVPTDQSFAGGHSSWKPSVEFMRATVGIRFFPPFFRRHADRVCVVGKSSIRGSARGEKGTARSNPCRAVNYVGG
jgi:hypothetical protein